LIEDWCGLRDYSLSGLVSFAHLSITSKISSRKKSTSGAVLRWRALGRAFSPLGLCWPWTWASPQAGIASGLQPSKQLSTPAGTSP
jgi:hypothetical protein